ncbi:MAG TPA: heme-degrading domain-containing protein, partial [Granulicella sp.]|nr:heme-degrading domain-containing protein [Granulicella sp.]
MALAPTINGSLNSPEDRARITEQEHQLVFPAFDAHTAWSLGSTLRRLAVERNHSLVIDIRRFGNPFEQLFYAALPGTTPDNGRWVQRKSNVVARFHRSSYAVGLYLSETGTTIAEKYALPESDYAVHGGAFPLIVTGAGVLGSIT